MRSVSPTLNARRLSARVNTHLGARLATYLRAEAASRTVSTSDYHPPPRPQPPGLDALTPTPYGPRLTRRC